MSAFSSTDPAPISETFFEGFPTSDDLLPQAIVLALPIVLAQRKKAIRGETSRKGHLE
jgi:hypothetical protein